MWWNRKTLILFFDWGVVRYWPFSFEVWAERVNDGLRWSWLNTAFILSFRNVHKRTVDCVYGQNCQQAPRIPYNPPKCVCFYDKYGILCRPGCKRVMLIKNWKTYLPVLSDECPECENRRNKWPHSTGPFFFFNYELCVTTSAF
jgi:hypothetical protein